MPLFEALYRQSPTWFSWLFIPLCSCMEGTAVSLAQGKLYLAVHYNLLQHAARDKMNSTSLGGSDTRRNWQLLGCSENEEGVGNTRESQSCGDTCGYNAFQRRQWYLGQHGQADPGCCAWALLLHASCLCFRVSDDTRWSLISGRKGTSIFASGTHESNHGPFVTLDRRKATLIPHPGKAPQPFESPGKRSAGGISIGLANAPPACAQPE